MQAVPAWNSGISQIRSSSQGSRSPCRATCYPPRWRSGGGCWLLVSTYSWDSRKPYPIISDIHPILSPKNGASSSQSAMKLQQILVPGPHADSRPGGALHRVLPSGLLGFPGRPYFPGRRTWDEDICGWHMEDFTCVCIINTIMMRIIYKYIYIYGIHAHTHRYMYIYIYMHICVCVCFFC